MPSEPRGLSTRIDTQRRRAMARELQAWLREEREEEVGELAAGFLLDFVLDLAGPDLYNAALTDAGKAFREHADIVEAEIASLTQDTFKPREAAE
ncbi:MAG: DUF2164 domain-containing protein [Dehalococcoidia bacterium]|nr:DUF2164 domain-containing protein [Dehalococcoidia bacterium]MYA52368.1 DUF2164 domain-containing protein [Dehalococcoidia bacterium]